MPPIPNAGSIQQHLIDNGITVEWVEYEGGAEYILHGVPVDQQTTAETLVNEHLAANGVQF